MTKIPTEFCRWVGSVIGFIHLGIRANKHHLNLWHFINCQKQEEVYFLHQVTQVRAGTTTRSKTKKTKYVQHRIYTLVARYEYGEIKLEECLSFVVDKDKCKMIDC